MRRPRAVGRTLAGLAILTALASTSAHAQDPLRAPATARTSPPTLALALAPLTPGPDPGPQAAAIEPLALSTAFPPAGEIAVRVSGGKAGPAPRKPGRPRRNAALALTPERAQALLRSMTIPGWGQATLGHRTAGAVFAVAETGVWGSFIAFRIQEQLRRDASIRTARIFAGIDLAGRDEEFLRIVGSYASSDEYNRLVVMRDAANQFYNDPDAYRAYIAKYSLSGTNGWTWQDEASFLRYGAQRKDSQRAALRANTALALAIANRLLSILHVARIAGTRPAPGARSWNFEVVPAGGQDPTAFRCGVRASF